MSYATKGTGSLLSLSFKENYKQWDNIIAKAILLSLFQKRIKTGKVSIKS